MKIRIKLFLLILILMAVFCACNSSPEPSALPSPSQTETKTSNLTVSMVNVGAADCFILYSGDACYLIDTARKGDYDIVKEALQKKEITEIDGVILTHGHKDHIGGLAKLLEDYPVNAVYYSANDTVTYQDRQVEELFSGAVAVTAGQSIPMFGSSMEVLAAPYDTDDENNNSLVLRLKYGDTIFLFMGDAKSEVETQLITSGLDLKADFLKVGHHGENDASMSAFLSAVRPKYAAVTGNASDEADTADGRVISRLKEIGAQAVVSQGEFLTADFISDGKSLKLQYIMK